MYTHIFGRKYRTNWNKEFCFLYPKSPFLYLADSESRVRPFIQLNVTIICLFIFLMCVTVYMYVLVCREETGLFKSKTLLTSEACKGLWVINWFTCAMLIDMRVDMDSVWKHLINLLTIKSKFLELNLFLSCAIYLFNLKACFHLR